MNRPRGNFGQRDERSLRYDIINVSITFVKKIELTEERNLFWNHYGYVRRSIDLGNVDINVVVKAVLFN